MPRRVARRALLGGLTAACFAPSAVHAAEAAGAVETSRGDCYAEAAARRRALAPAAEVFIGDAVGTGAQSALGLRLGSVTRVKLGAETRLRIDRFLVDAPEGPLSFKAYDGKASFDGRTVRFRWFWTGASSAKWKAGDQSFAVSELTGVEWRSPELFEGHLRLLRGEPAAAPADQDPATVVFGLGYGPVHESLPFAAAVLAAVRNRGPAAMVPASVPRRDPSDIAERIRHLGELHRAGLVTDEEFSVKKAELLSEL